MSGMYETHFVKFKNKMSSKYSIIPGCRIIVSGPKRRVEILLSSTSSLHHRDPLFTRNDDKNEQQLFVDQKNSVLVVAF